MYKKQVQRLQNIYHVFNADTDSGSGYLGTIL